jgi:SAM-dependent methyltransferase
MIETIEFKGEVYPKFQSTGGASFYCRPFALSVLSGEGLDIGFGKEEWKYPDAIGVDLTLNNGYHAYNLPEGKFDYVHSSHLLEHLPDWVGALNLWSESIKSGGVLFIYLPDKSQRYWNPFNNRKHMSCFYPEIIKQYLVDSGMYKNIFVSGVDAYNSFTAFAEKI